MAECSHNSITVNNAGVGSVNGTYIKAGTNIVHGETFTIYTQDGNSSSNPKIYVRSGGPSNSFVWLITGPTGGFGFQEIYYTQTSMGIENFSNCPTDLSYTTLVAGPPWGSPSNAPAPTVTAAGGGGGGSPSSPAVKIENANVKFFGKTKFVV